MQANLTLKDLINSRSQTYKQINPNLDAMNETEIYDLINTNPRILIRPLLSDGEKVLLGFKVDQYKAYIE